MRKILITLIKGYQYLISPFLPPTCRFTPSCSSYAEESLRVHGAVKGGWLATKRVCKCHPFHEGGYDPVPPATITDTHNKGTA